MHTLVIPLILAAALFACMGLSNRLSAEEGQPPGGMVVAPIVYTETTPGVTLLLTEAVATLSSETPLTTGAMFIGTGGMVFISSPVACEIKVTVTCPGYETKEFDIVVPSAENPHLELKPAADNG